MTGRGGRIGGGIGANQPFVVGTSHSVASAPTAPQYNQDTPTTLGQGRKRTRPQDDANGASDPKKPRKKRRSRCGKCISCLEKEDCGICMNCKDQRRYGGPNRRHARCIKRQCQKLKYGPKQQTNKHVGKRVSATKFGIGGGSEATGHLGGGQSVAQTGGEQAANPVRTSVTGDNEDSYSSDWSSTDVSVNEDQDDAGEQEREMAQWEIAQLKEKLKSKEEFILIQKHDSQEQIKNLQQQILKEREMAQREIAQLKERLKSKEEFILIQKHNSQEQISELEAWKKSIKEKIRSLASAAE